MIGSDGIEDRKMLMLSGREMEQAVSFPELIETAESAMRLYETDHYCMPARMHVDVSGTTLLLMPCAAGEHFGTKLVSVTPGNRERGLPMIHGLMVLNDGTTGAPLSLMDGSRLTALRTGAAGAASIRRLARAQVSRLGVVGAGVQGFYQALFACSVRPFREVLIHDLITERARRVAADLRTRLPEVTVEVAENVTRLTEASDVIITATTSSSPVLPDTPALLEGKHIVGIGSFKPQMKEFPRSLVELAEWVFVDTEHALQESGDLIDPLREGWLDQSRVFTLGKALDQPDLFRPGPGRTTVFKSVGMALFDLAAAVLIDRNARRQGLGQNIDLD